MYLFITLSIDHPLWEWTINIISIIFTGIERGFFSLQFSKGIYACMLKITGEAGSIDNNGVNTRQLNALINKLQANLEKSNSLLESTHSRW